MAAKIPLIFILISCWIFQDCQATPFATTLTTQADTVTSTSADLLVSTAEPSTELSAAAATCVPACTDPAPTYDAAVATESVKVSLTGLTPATRYVVSVLGSTITNDNAEAAANPPDADVCTKGADLALTIGTATETGIPVSWTVPTEGELPSSYKLYIGTTLIHTIAAADVGDGEYTFTASDAAGTALMMDTDYECKIEAEIGAFGTTGSEECAASTVEEMKDCKLSSGAAFFFSNAALLGLLITKLFA